MHGPIKPIEQPTPRLFIVDDEELIRNLVLKLVRRLGYPVEAFGSPSEFLATAQLEPPCCLVLDVHLPGMTGIDLQQRLVGLAVPPSIVFISGDSDIPTSVRAMKAGAVDFLTKPFSGDELLAAVEQGVARSLARLESHRVAEAARAQLATLTPREREVCEAMARGLRSKEIAEELGAALKTVNIHRSRVLAKLEVSSVADLVRLLSLAGGSRG